MTRLTAPDTPRNQRLGEAPLSVQLESVSVRIRAEPTSAAHRWAMFQLMCVTGEWSRAIQQLQTWAKLEPEQAPAAQVYRDLIRAERWRGQVVDGRERPGFAIEPPAWIDGLLEALRFGANREVELADDARQSAFDTAPTVAVQLAQENAAWIADSDSRFGPVCEVITAGHYRWVPFADLASWRLSPPTKLIDLVWVPCTLTLVDATILHGFMPARYPHSERGDDAVRLGRTTVWLDSGRTGVTALGQKTWMTDKGDFSLFEVPNAEFGARVADDVIVAKDIDD